MSQHLERCENGNIVVELIMSASLQDPVGPAGSRPMLVRGGDVLTMLVQRTPTSLLEPLTFFVSWQGVPTLVFR